MADSEQMRVEVVYGLPEQQWLLPVTVPVGTTVAGAIQASGICSIRPEIDLNTQRVGIFSRLAELDTPLSSGDRVEIYRPLLVDPKAQRKERARQQKA